MPARCVICVGLASEDRRRAASTGRIGPMEDRLGAAVARTSLLGRAGECDLLNGLVSDVRDGTSRSLVLRGEAGIGKTALLAYMVDSLSDVAVVRAVGVESEMELAYASLHQLCAPLLGCLGSLPA